MASLAEFLSMPMSGGPNARPFGVDELGNTAFRGVLGPDYRVVQQAPNRESVVRGLLSQIMDAPGPTLANLAKGAAQGTWDAISAPGRSWSDSTMTYGDVANTAGLVSLPAVAGKYDPAVANMGIRAYHGSPHDFDRFDISKIGTGEGAQAYGHGLYFAEAEDVAKEYRTRLTDMNASAAQRAVAFRNGDVAAAIEDAKRKIEIYSEKVKDPNAPDLAHRLLQINRQKLKDLESGVEQPGHLYEVSINADPADFLDWDAPLSEQRAFEAIKKDWDKNLGDPNIIMERLGITPETTGQGYLNQLVPGAGSANAGVAQRLREQNVPGIKYYDQGSRAGKGGTRNYVVFDDSLIEILRKYGLAGAMLGFGAYPQESSQ